MISVRGIFDGKEIKPLEKFQVPPNVEVIITFTDRKITEPEVSDDTKSLLELCGTWEDERSADDIIKDIYENRTAGTREVNL